MLKRLIKKQMAEIFRSYFYDAKKNKARSKASTAAYIIFFILLMAGLLGGIFTLFSLLLCESLASAGFGWLYFTIMGLLSIMLGTFGSVFNTYSGLYLAKDNDLMLSLPIPASALMASRLVTVYLMGLMYSATLIVPAAVVYWVKVSAALPAVLGGLVLVLLISVFVLVLSCALGWVVAKISLKLKNKSLITALISLLFVGGYYFFYFRANVIIQDILINAGTYGAAIQGYAYPLYLLGQVGVGNGFACLIVSTVITALLWLMWTVLSRSFLKIVASGGKTEHRTYKETRAKQKSITAALLGREFLHFTGNPTYMLNCGLSVLLFPLCGGLLLWKGERILTALEMMVGGHAGSVSVILCTVLCCLVFMTETTPPSVSLEGKSLWLLQSLPVTPWQVLKAKMWMQFLLSWIPCVICMACMAVVYPMSTPAMSAAVLLVLSCAGLSALFGLFLGLKMPTLSWTSEIVPIKQSGAVMITLLGGMVYTALLAAGYLLLPGWKLGFVGYTACFIALNLLLCTVLRLWMKRKGCAIFAAL